MTHLTVRLPPDTTAAEARRIGQALQAKAMVMLDAPLGGAVHKRRGLIQQALAEAPDAAAFVMGAVRAAHRKAFIWGALTGGVCVAGLIAGLL